MVVHRLFQAAASAAALGLCAPAAAQVVVPFNGTIVPSCILTLSSSGVLAMDTSGTELGSEQNGGSAAVLGITATGGAPTVTFAAPTMTARPTAYTGSPTISLSYTSPGGANQAYTSGSSQYKSTNPLSDTVTLHARAADVSGFAAGSYRLQTTATCQQ